MLRQTIAGVLLSKNNYDHETLSDAMVEMNLVWKSFECYNVEKTLAILIDSVGHFVWAEQWRHYSAMFLWQLTFNDPSHIMCRKAL